MVPVVHTCWSAAGLSVSRSGFIFAHGVSKGVSVGAFEEKGSHMRFDANLVAGIAIVYVVGFLVGMAIAYVVCTVYGFLSRYAGRRR